MRDVADEACKRKGKEKEIKCKRKQSNEKKQRVKKKKSFDPPALLYSIPV